MFLFATLSTVEALNKLTGSEKKRKPAINPFSKVVDKTCSHDIP